MTKRRALVIAVGVITFFLFVGILISEAEFLVENDVDHWDFKLLLLLVLTGVGLVATMLSVIMNRYFSHHLVVPVLLVMLFLGVKALPVRLADYRQVFYPISNSEVDKVSRLKLSKDDDYQIYLYRSDDKESIRFMSRLKACLKAGDQSVETYDLTRAKAKLTTGQYAALIKRLGVEKLPTMVFSYRGLAKNSKPSMVTFNAINDQTRFSTMQRYLNGDRDKISGPGIVFRGSEP
ncbi:hypothetical protein ACFQET_05835 [Levilactobacillus tangyuanensis]|uniref:Uncharacterized protein n=1 Tax=Levilactobacillus tangyuanensis TaxID=2486021 RepID=A0ABW1TQJ9_9LACO|nr:hypothetical protein [Levilactobacillus tangyuanensis]